MAGTGARRRYPHPTKSRGRVGSRGPEGGSHPSGYDPAIGAESPAPLTFDDVARLVVDLAEHLRDRHDLMLVITRGGLIPGGILAYLAGYKNIVVAAVEFYDDDGRRGAEPAFHQFPSAELLAYLGLPGVSRVAYGVWVSLLGSIVVIAVALYGTNALRDT